MLGGVFGRGCPVEAAARPRPYTGLYTGAFLPMAQRILSSFLLHHEAYGRECETRGAGWRWLTFLCTGTQYLVKSSIAWPGQKKWFLVLTPTQRSERLGPLVRDEIHSVCWLPAGGAPAASFRSRGEALCFNEWDALMDAMLESLNFAGSDVVEAAKVQAAKAKGSANSPGSD